MRKGPKDPYLHSLIDMQLKYLHLYLVFHYFSRMEGNPWVVESIKISTHPFYHINLGWFSWKWSKKNLFFFEKKIQNGRLKKSSFFKIANSQNFFTKISQMGPWVSRIEWCEGHWCSSTYMAVRLSDKSSKTAKKYRKCIFWLFLSFCRTASRPYTLSYINALRIIQSY